MDNHNKDTANFLASLFLGSNICLHSVYKLKSFHPTMIRYICDGIDKNFSKRGKFENRMYQSQIAKFSFISRKTANKEIQYLIRKRILKLSKKNTYTVGKVLIACNRRLHPIEVLPTVTCVRSVTDGYTSNSSKFTNGRSASYKDKNHENKVASVDNQSTSYGYPGEDPEESKRKYDEHMKYLLDQ